MDGLRQQIAENIRWLRTAIRGWSQADLAARMTAAGRGRWSPAMVAGLERLDQPRALSIEDLGVLCLAFDCALDELLAGDEELIGWLRGTTAAQRASLEDAALDARRAEQSRVLNMLLIQRVRASSYRQAPLEISDDDVLAAARDLWGRSPLEEREDRLLLDDSLSSPAQRRGHITREMGFELDDYLKDF